MIMINAFNALQHCTKPWRNQITCRDSLKYQTIYKNLQLERNKLSIKNWRLEKILYIIEKEICPADISKINSNCEKGIILLMIPNVHSSRTVKILNLMKNYG